MLISLKEALDYAEHNKVGIAAINTPTYEMLLAAVRTAEQHNIPLILQHAEVHEPINTIEDIGPVMVELAKRSTAPLVVHVDHGESYDYVKRGFDVGFNSAMIDASRLPYDDNLALTQKVVALANEYGYGVEAELGVMPGREDGSQASTGTSNETLYTDPDLAQSFVRDSGVTALACSFGTVHGLYKAEPNLNYNLISTLREKTGVPIVMLGGSGLTDSEYRECIKRGVAKINYYTYADKASFEAVQNYLAEKPETFIFSDLTTIATKAVQQNLNNLVGILYGKS